MSNIQSVNTNSYNLVNENSDNTKSILALMEELAEVMNYFQNLIAKYDSSTQSDQAIAANAASQAAEKNAEKIQKQIQEIQKAKEAAEHRSFFQKAVDAVVPAVGIVAGAILTFTGSPEIGLPLIALSVAMYLHGPQALAGLFSKMLAKMGVPEEYAKPLGDLLTVIVITALTVGAGDLIAGEMGAEMAVEEGAEMAAEEGTETGAEESTNILKRAVGKVLEAIGTRGGLALTAISQLLGGIDFAGDVTNALPVSEEEKRKLGLILEIIQMVAGLVSALLGGGAIAANAANTAASAADDASGAQKLVAKVQQLITEHPNFIMGALAALQLGSGGASTAFQFVSAAKKEKVAERLKALAPLQADQLLDASAVKISDNTLKEETKQFGVDISTINEMLDIVYHMTDVMGDVAHATAS